MRIPTVEELPAIPDGINLWDGETACETVRCHWIHPDNWQDGRWPDDRPVLELYQAVIGIPDDDGWLAVHHAAKYLESLDWQITGESSNKDWLEIQLHPPLSAWPIPHPC